MRRFFILFILVQGVLFAVELLQPVQEHVISVWTAGLAQTCVGLVTLFDGNAVAQGKVLWNPSNGFGVSIESGCNGIEAFIVLCSAIIAFPSGWRNKIWGIAIGFLAIEGTNVIRVVSLFYLGQVSQTAFRIAHEYLWQGLIMIDALVVWLLWMRLAAPASRLGEMRAC